MKYSLLDMTQDILNDMDSDEVNSIDDTVESAQVAQIIKTCYHEWMSNRNWPHMKRLIQFDALGTLAKPNYILIPDNVKELVSFKYNMKKEFDGRDEYREVKWKEPDSFLRYVSNRDSTKPNVTVVSDFSGTTLNIFNDTAPQFWTSFDDQHMILDAYNIAVESTIVKSKTQCIAYLMPTWVHEDSAIPNLPNEAFAGFLEECKSTAFLALKQMPNEKAEMKAQRQQRWLSRKAWTAMGGVKYPNYGRRGRR